MHLTLSVQQTESVAAAQRLPLVGIAVDAASGFGRGILRGTMRYANAFRRWDVHTVLYGHFEPPLGWAQCDGAIVAGVGPELHALIDSRTRHVVSCCDSDEPAFQGPAPQRPTQAAALCVDDDAAGAMAADHLLECGLDKFSFYGSSVSACSGRRERGFAACLERRGKSHIPCPIPYAQSARGGLLHWPSLIAWLGKLPKPVGIAAMDDSAADDLAAACRHAGIHVPEQVAIIGVDNDELICESAVSPLSSVDCGYERTGYAAAQLLDRLLRGERLGVAQRLIRLPPLHVVRRQSTDVLAVDEPLVADAVRYIREHACDPCSVEDVLRHVPAGRRWLERQFESKLGRSPRDEILRVQLETAKRLLLQPGLTLPDIALRCGFSGAPTLGRAFARTLGQTPSVYRRSMLGPPE